jgi:hypothetical protein
LAREKCGKPLCLAVLETNPKPALCASWRDALISRGTFKTELRALVVREANIKQ